MNFPLSSSLFCQIYRMKKKNNTKRDGFGKKYNSSHFLDDSPILNRIGYELARLGWHTGPLMEPEQGTRGDERGDNLIWLRGSSLHPCHWYQRGVWRLAWERRKSISSPNYYDDEWSDDNAMQQLLCVWGEKGNVLHDECKVMISIR